VTRTSKVAAALLVLALSVGALAGCVAPATEKPVSLVGEWTSPDTAGKVASLSDLTLRADGTFRYAGKSAIGGPVAFGGTYQLGDDVGSPCIRLVYADFPDRPTVWYYRLDGKQLLVSTVKGNLTNGSALTFMRK
jgi:hypothetical protein